MIFAENHFFAQGWHVEKSIPPALAGIWQGSDRFVLFSSIKSNGEPAVSIMLKTLYDWYYDRCAEPESFSEYNRDLNSVTGAESVKLYADFANLLEKPSENGGAWEITVTYSDKSKTVIPVAKIGDKLYLNFLIKISQNDLQNDSENSLYGAWLGTAAASGIGADKPVIEKELISYYITDNSVYYIRYWQTDMEYSPLQATFSDGELTYTIPKHIKSAGKIYTCVSGRSLQIRNVTRSPLTADEFTIDSSGQILVYAKPYLTLMESSGIDETADIERYIQLALDASKRRKPEPPPLFPPDDINWHWKEIHEIEKGNPQVQQVRERQKQFARQSQAVNGR